MVKCPFCKMHLSNGNELLIHINTKHRDQEPSFEKIHVSRKRGNRKNNKKIVVDGNNVAYYAGEPPHIYYLKLLRGVLKKKGYEPIIIVSSALRHKIDDKLELIRLINLNWIIEAESGENDDKLVIETALSNNCKIITNDRFLDHMDFYNNLSDILIKFNIIGNKISFG